MKPQSQRLIDEAKHRAYMQIDFALRKMAKDGNPGSDFFWWDTYGRQRIDKAYYQNFYNFRLGERQGEEDVPLFYNQPLHDWDSVLNMPIEDLCRCADFFIYDFQRRK